MPNRSLLHLAVADNSGSEDGLKKIVHCAIFLGRHLIRLSDDTHHGDRQGEAET
jgi:hypothetical protein